MTPHLAGARDADNRLRTPATILSVAHLNDEERGTYFVQPRWAISFLRGPMTRHEIRRARATCPAVLISRRPIVSSL